MVAFYVRMIKAGRVTNIYKVASKWREDVIEQITAEGYVIQEDGTIELAE